MTVMLPHAARLAESATLLLLDPVVGPVARAIATLALGDEVLVVAEGRMCFRRIMSSHEAVSPPQIAIIPRNHLGADHPRQSIALDSRQPVGLPIGTSALTPAGRQASDRDLSNGTMWMDVCIEGAERIVVDNVAIATGPLPESEDIPVPVPPVSESVAFPPAARVQPVIAAVRAYNGPLELPLLSALEKGGNTIHRFTLPPRTTTLRLSSHCRQPDNDGRKLGVAVFRITIEAADIPLDSPVLVRGFHRAESGEGLTWRWTDGEALLILPPKPVPQTLEVTISDWHLLLA